MEEEQEEVQEYGGVPTTAHEMAATCMLEIYIETLTGSVFQLNVNPFEPIVCIKAKIARHEGIPVSQQHLIWRQVEMDDDKSLYEYYVPNMATLRLVLGMRGGPINTRRIAMEELPEYVDFRDEFFERFPSHAEDDSPEDDEDEVSGGSAGSMGGGPPTTAGTGLSRQQQHLTVVVFQLGQSFERSGLLLFMSHDTQEGDKWTFYKLVDGSLDEEEDEECVTPLSDAGRAALSHSASPTERAGGLACVSASARPMTQLSPDIEPPPAAPLPPSSSTPLRSAAAAPPYSSMTQYSQCSAHTASAMAGAVQGGGLTPLPTTSSAQGRLSANPMERVDENMKTYGKMLQLQYALAQNKFEAHVSREKRTAAAAAASIAFPALGANPGTSLAAKATPEEAGALWQLTKARLDFLTDMANDDEAYGLTSVELKAINKARERTSALLAQLEPPKGMKARSAPPYKKSPTLDASTCLLPQNTPSPTKDPAQPDVLVVDQRTAMVDAPQNSSTSAAPKFTPHPPPSRKEQTPTSVAAQSPQTPTSLQPTPPVGVFRSQSRLKKMDMSKYKLPSLHEHPNSLNSSLASDKENVAPNVVCADTKESIPSESMDESSALVVSETNDSVATTQPTVEAKPEKQFTPHPPPPKHKPKSDLSPLYVNTKANESASPSEYPQLGAASHFSGNYSPSRIMNYHAPPPDAYVTPHLMESAPSFHMDRAKRYRDQMRAESRNREPSGKIKATPSPPTASHHHHHHHQRMPPRGFRRSKDTLLLKSLTTSEARMMSGLLHQSFADQYGQFTPAAAAAAAADSATIESAERTRHRTNDSIANENPVEPTGSSANGARAGPHASPYLSSPVGKFASPSGANAGLHRPRSGGRRLMRGTPRGGASAAHPAGSAAKLPPVAGEAVAGVRAAPARPGVPAKPAHKRCLVCNKRTGLTSSYDCRCGGNYCAQHRYAETHACTFDYKAEGRRALRQSNPVVSAPKLPKI